MELEQLRTFVEVAKGRSISRAARALAVSQPAVSRQLQRLEQALGAALIERDRRPLALTQAGQELLKFAERTLADYEALLARLRGRSGTVKGRLSIAASTIPGEFIVPRLMLEFGQRYPGVEASAAIMDTEQVVEQLLAGNADLGFIGAPLRRGRLTLARIARDEIVLAVPAGHPLALRASPSDPSRPGLRPSLRLEELAGEPLLLREEGSGTYRTLFRRLKEKGMALPRHSPAMTLGNSRAIVAAVRTGMGLGFVSSLALADQPDTAVRGLPIEGLDLGRDLYMAYDPGKARTSPLKEAVQFIYGWREGPEARAGWV